MDRGRISGVDNPRSLERRASTPPLYRITISTVFVQFMAGSLDRLVRKLFVVAGMPSALPWRSQEVSSMASKSPVRGP